MAKSIIAMPLGRLTLSRIAYHCDLQSANGSVIPLGTIAEMTLGPIRALGLIARTYLSEDEIARIGALVRHRLATPFDFLEEDFDWAWSNTEAGHALAALAEKHSASLCFSPPASKDIRPRKGLDLESGHAAEFADDNLRHHRDKEFFAMLAETWTGPKIVPRRTVIELAPAA